MATEGGSPDEQRLRRRRFALAIVAAALVLLAIRLTELGGGCNGTPPGPALKLPPDPEPGFRY